MHVEILTEELSAMEALKIIVPKIVPNVSVSFHAYQGKYDLFKKIPLQLKLYSMLDRKKWRYVVLVDRDQDNCLHLKHRLNSIVFKAGLIPSPHSHFTVLNRIVCEELEAWFFGDLRAICSAFPKISYETLHNKPEYADPDAIVGGTWEALFHELHDYYRRSLPKMRTARMIASYMNPDVNRSASFCAFRDGLRKLRDTFYD